MPHTVQPGKLRECLSLVDRGTSRSLACALTECDPETIEPELTQCEQWRNARIEIRLFVRFELGGDLKAYEMWQASIRRFNSDDPTSRLSLRDLFADDPLLLQHVQQQEEAWLRTHGKPVQPESATPNVDTSDTRDTSLPATVEIDPERSEEDPS